MRAWPIRVLLVVAVLAGASACGGDDGDGASSDEFCDLARRADTAGDSLNAAFATGDPAEVERVFGEALTDFEAAADAAPDAISDIAAEVTETAQDLRDRFEELEWDPAVVLQDERALEIAAQSEEANTELDRFLEQECDIPPDTETAETDPPGTDVAATAPAGGATEGLLLDELTRQFEALGLSADQARCLGESLLGTLGIEGIAGLADLAEFDLSSPEGQAFIDALAECDIDPTVLAGES
jgi:hypothetical protein